MPCFPSFVAIVFILTVSSHGCAKTSEPGVLSAQDAAGLTAALAEGGIVVLRAPTGEEEPQWVEGWRGILLELEEAALWVPWHGAARLGWRVVDRHLLLGKRVVAHLWHRLGAPEVLAALGRLSVSDAYLVLGSETLTPEVTEALGRRLHLRLAVVCPLGRPCGLERLRRLAPAVRALCLKDAHLDTADLRQLGRMTGLWSLSLRGAHLPAGFEGPLSALRGLRVLDLAGARAKRWDTALSALLGGLTRLAWLDLSHTRLRLSPGVLAGFQALPALRTLRLAATLVHDADLPGLAGLDALVELDLSLSAIGDSGMPAVGELTGLRALDLRDTEVTDLGAPHLARLRRLTLLFAPRHLTDLGLGWLDGLRGLEGLSFRFSATSIRGFERLKALPRLWWLDGSDLAPP